MAKLADLKVSIGLSKTGLTKLNSQLKTTRAKFQRNFGAIQGMAKAAGRSMTMAITMPLALMAAASLKSFNQQAKAIAQVDAGLKSTGAQVGYTSDQLQQLARNLQNNTLFGDEEILKDATAQLLTFTNIAGTQFARTQKAALDLATRLDGDLKSSSIQLGKALNDPIANLSALSRSGIQFSTDQKAVIKSLQETGRLAEAQTLILDELEKQHGGSAEAAAKAGTGPFKQLQNTIGDLTEQFGRLIAEVLIPIIPKIQAFVKSMSDMSTGAKRSVLIIAALVGAAGPIAMAIGALMPLMAAMTGPIGLTILALGALVTAAVTFRKEISEPLAAVANGFIDLYNESSYVRVGVHLLGQQFITAFKLMKLQADIFWTSLSIEGDMAKAAQIISDGFGQIAKDVEIAAFDIGTGMAEAIGDGLRDRLEHIDPEDISDALDFSSLLDFGGPGGSVEVPVTPVLTTTKPQAATGLMIPEGGYQQTAEDVSNMNREVAVSVDLANAATNAFMGFGAALAAVATGTMNMGELLGATLTSLADLLAQMGQQFIRAGVMALQFYANLIENPPLAIAAGVGLVVAAGVIRSIGAGLAESPPALAKGGLAFGPTMAIVGDNPNAMSDPEVIAPLSKLRGMMGGNNVQVTGRIDGRDILISSERSNFDRNRVRGF